MKEFIEWVADHILKGVSEDDYGEFLKSLRDNRDAMIEHLVPQMHGMPETYVISVSCPQKALVINADPGDRNIFFTIAKRAVNHLQKSLLDDIK